MSTEKQNTGRAIFESRRGNELPITFLSVTSDVKFNVQFRRLDSYKGEFGFDWMRPEYESICSNFEELREEYKSTTINNKEYFVPWLSMFPNQTNVSLQLELEKTNSGDKFGEMDIIKFPSKDGVSFEPSEVKVRDLEKNDEDNEQNGEDEKSIVAINVYCTEALKEDTLFDILDKNDDVVGHLNITKNDVIPTLPINFVKVKGNEPDNTYNKRTFDTFDEVKVIDFLSKLSLNQALINIKLNKVFEIELDVEDLIKKDVIRRDGGLVIPRFYQDRPDYDKVIHEIFNDDNPNVSGIVYFLSAIPPDGQNAGHSKPYPKKSNSILIVPDQVSINAKSTFIHELGHVLGLLHSFKDVFYKRYNNLILSKKSRIQKYKSKNNTKIKYDGKSLTNTEYINVLNDEINQLESLLENNEFKFNQSTTDNFMDYYNYSPISFNKYQWDIMRKEVIDYHGE